MNVNLMKLSRYVEKRIQKHYSDIFDEAGKKAIKLGIPKEFISGIVYIHTEGRLVFVEKTFREEMPYMMPFIEKLKKDFKNEAE